MEIEKKLIISLTTTDGQELLPNTKVVFEDNRGDCCCGIFKSVTEKGTIQIDSLLGKQERRMQASSIKRIYKAKVEVIEREKVD